MWRLRRRWSVNELLQISHLYLVSSFSPTFLSWSSFWRFVRHSCCWWEGGRNGWLWMKKWLPLNCGADAGCAMLGQSEDSRWLSETCRRFNDTSRSPSKDARTGIDSGMDVTLWSWKLTTAKLLAVNGKWCLWFKEMTECWSEEWAWCTFDKPFLGTELISLGGGGRFCNSYLELMLLHQKRSLQPFTRSVVVCRFSTRSAWKASPSHFTLGMEIAISCSKSLFNALSLNSILSAFSSLSIITAFNICSGEVGFSSEKERQKDFSWIICRS